MDVKLTTTEKVLDYIKEVKDIVQAKMGIPSAVARQFLRRVEKKSFGKPQRNSAKSAKN